MNSWKICTICERPFDDALDEKILVRGKGLNALISISVIKRDNNWKRWRCKNSVTFHVGCRKEYVLNKNPEPSVSYSELPERSTLSGPTVLLTLQPSLTSPAPSEPPVSSTPLTSSLPQPTSLVPSILPLILDEDISKYCTICDEPLEYGTTIVVGKKKLRTLILHSIKQQDDKWRYWQNKNNVTFHVRCEAIYLPLKETSETLADYSGEFCTICDELLGTGKNGMITVRKKNLRALTDISIEYQDGRWKRWENENQATFHVECRRQYIKIGSPILLSIPSILSFDNENISQYCTICDQLLDSGDDEVVQVFKREIRALIKCSVKLQDNRWKNWRSKDNVSFHMKCKARYFALIKSSKLQSSSVRSISPKNVPSEEGTFNFQELCLLCALPFDTDPETKIVTVSRDYFKTRVINIAKSRPSLQVLVQLMESTDSLVNAGARYHRRCYFQLIYVPSKKSIGRPIIKELQTAIDAACDLLEHNAGIKLKLSTLHNVMIDYYIPGNSTLFKKLKNRYKKNVQIEQHMGQEPTILYKGQKEPCSATLIRAKLEEKVEL